MEISLLAYFDIILKIISLCVRNLLIAYVLLLVHSWISGAAPYVGAGQAAWHQPGTGALLHLLLSERFSNQEEIRTFIFLIHVNEKKLSGDAFTAKTTSGLNDSSLSKGKLNITILKLQPFMPTIELLCGYCVCHHTILTDTYSLEDCRSDPVNQISITDTQAYKSNIY